MRAASLSRATRPGSPALVSEIQEPPRGRAGEHRNPRLRGRGVPEFPTPGAAGAVQHRGADAVHPNRGHQGRGARRRVKDRRAAYNAALRQNPSQGDNPNIALTRPHNTGPLTLVARCMAMPAESGASDKYRMPAPTRTAKSSFRGTTRGHQVRKHGKSDDTLAHSGGQQGRPWEGPSESTESAATATDSVAGLTSQAAPGPARTRKPGAIIRTRCPNPASGTQRLGERQSPCVSGVRTERCERCQADGPADCCRRWSPASSSSAAASTAVTAAISAASGLPDRIRMSGWGCSAALTAGCSRASSAAARPAWCAAPAAP